MNNQLTKTFLSRHKYTLIALGGIHLVFSLLIMVEVFTSLGVNDPGGDLASLIEDKVAFQGGCW